MFIPKRPLLELLAAFRRGIWRDVKIRLGRLQSFVANAEPVNLSFLADIDDLDMVGQLNQGLTGRSSSLTSLASMNTLNNNVDDTFTYEQAVLDQIAETDEQSKLVDIYYASRSHVEKTQILVKLSSSGNTDESIDGLPVRGLLNNLLRQFTRQKDWINVRLVAAHCRKLVDSLAPSVTTILCEGRQLSIGVFGRQEITITSPLSPAEISHILYTVVFDVNPSEAVLQQEIILTIGQRILVTQPQLLNQILNIRIGWIIEAMRFELSQTSPGQSIYALSPSEVKALLEKVLCEQDQSHDHFRRRRLEGALNKAPKDFYHHVWRLLARSESGIKIANNIIAPEPTLSDMDATDVGFKLLVENILGHVKEPEHRQVVIETLIIISTVLKRNPELQFNSMVDIDVIIDDACSGHFDNKTDFYSLSTPKLIKFISHSVIKTLLTTGDIKLPHVHSCKVS